MMSTVRIRAFCAMSTAASRLCDMRYASGGHAPGSPAKVALAEQNTTLCDLRIAHTLACGNPPADIQRNGLKTLEASLRRRIRDLREKGQHALADRLDGVHAEMVAGTW